MDKEIAILGTINLGYQQAPVHKKKELFEKFKAKVSECQNKLDQAQKILDDIEISETSTLSLQELTNICNLAPEASFEELLTMIQSLNQLQKEKEVEVVNNPVVTSDK